MAGKNRKSRRAVTAAVLAAALAFPFDRALNAGEMYAQAIGQPPEREATPPPAKKEPPKPPPAETPPEPTARTETPPPAAEGNMRTRILIGAGVALALAALGGGGGGGTEAPPASTAVTSP